MCVCMYMYLLICIYLDILIHIFFSNLIHLFIHININIYIYIYIYIYTYIYIYVCIETIYACFSTHNYTDQKLDSTSVSILPTMCATDLWMCVCVNVCLCVHIFARIRLIGCPNSICALFSSHLQIYVQKLNLNTSWDWLIMWCVCMCISVCKYVCMCVCVCECCLCLFMCFLCAFLCARNHTHNRTQLLRRA